MRSGRIGSLRALLLVAALSTIAVATGMHSAPPPKFPKDLPPPGPPPPPAMNIDIVPIEPPRWAWHHWWEINRERFLVPIGQSDEGQLPDQDEVQRMRDEAVLALSQIAADPDTPDDVRAAALVALGRIGDELSLAHMLRIAGNRTGWVARASMLGIGLLDLPTSEPALIQFDVDLDEERDDHAAVVALAMLSRSTDPKALPGLDRYMSGKWGAALASAAAIAYAELADDTRKRRVLDVIQSSEVPGVVAPLLEWLGRNAQQRRPDLEINVLRSILFNEQRADLAVVRKLEEWREQRKLRMIAVRNAPNQPLQQDAIKKLNDVIELVRATIPAWQLPNAGAFNAVGFEDIQFDNVRTSAAVGLGHIDHPAARQALLDCLDLRADASADNFKAMAIMALGEHEPLGRPVARDKLHEIFANTDSNGNAKPAGRLSSPLRGFAAIARGLYCRPVETAQGPADREQVDKVAELLAERAADVRETTEVRAASIVALGLTARTENLRYLQKLSDMIDASDELLIGYIFLARGLLADANILEPARRFLDPTNDSTTSEAIIARRAAVLGVGSVRTDESIPVLVNAWDLNFYVNREVILALRLCNAYSVTSQLIELAESGATDYSRMFGAEALGVLYDRTQPDRIDTRLLHERNFMLRNDAMTPYKSIGNEFFYEYLAPLLGGDWL
jgi:hypothetical protein